MCLNSVPLIDLTLYPPDISTQDISISVWLHFSLIMRMLSGGVQNFNIPYFHSILS